MTDKITIERETTYTHAEVRKMLDGISADARQYGLEVVDNLDGTMGLRAALAAQPAEPEYWQWRRKSERWEINQIYRHEVYATTDDSEVRKLYAAIRRGD